MSSIFYGGAMKGYKKFIKRLLKKGWRRENGDLIYGREQKHKKIDIGTPYGQYLQHLRDSGWKVFETHIKWSEN